jgi:hypothetical protein
MVSTDHHERTHTLFAGLNESTMSKSKQDCCYSAFNGRHVRMGARQSIPSNNIANCAEVIATLPLIGDGHTNRPRSSRFENRQAPWPSHQMIFKRSPRRPRKTNRWPENGSCSKASWARMLRPLNPFRISVTPDASQIFVLAGTGIIALIAQRQ